MVLRFGSINAHLRHYAHIAVLLQSFAYRRLKVRNLLNLRLVQVALNLFSALGQGFGRLQGRAVFLVWHKDAETSEVHGPERLRAEGVFCIVNLAK